MITEDFFTEHFNVVNEVSTYWKELLCDGKHRTAGENTYKAIAYFYDKQNLPDPKLVLSANPLEHTINITQHYQIRRANKLRYYYTSAVEIEKAPHELLFSNYFRCLPQRWNQLIWQTIPDFHPLPDTIGSLPFDKICYNLGLAINDILHWSLVRKNNTLEKCEEVYNKWTGNSLPAIVDNIVLAAWKDIRSALQFYRQDDLTSLFPLMPVYDLFYRLQVFTDDDFHHLKLLFQAGIYNMVPFEDVCFILSMPDDIKVSKQKLHEDNGPAIVFKNGFNIYFNADSYYPQQLLRQPKVGEKESLADGFTAPQLAQLYELVGPKRITDLMETKVIAQVEIDGYEISLLQPPVRLRHWNETNSVYILKRRNLNSGQEDFKYFGQVKAKKIRTILLSINKVKESRKDDRKYASMAGSLKIDNSINFELNTKETRFTDTQIVSILKQQGTGIPTKEICREHGISEATFYLWKSKYGGMEASDIKRLKNLQTVNAHLKRMSAYLSLDNNILTDFFTEEGWALPTKDNK